MLSCGEVQTFMKTEAPTRSLFLLFAFIFPLLAGCGAVTTNAPAGRELTAQGRTARLGESFKLAREEKVSIEGTNLTALLKSVRRTWYVDGRGETAEADIIIALDGREQRQWMDVGEKLIVGDYEIVLSGADPFGKTSAHLIVTRR
jgi:hypothetical protein